MSARQSGEQDALRILTVCTGNICRSPAAEYLLNEALGASVRVTSAGTRAVVGHPVERTMDALLPMATDAFAARQLSPRIVQNADLVLALSREHRSRVVALAPTAVRHAFTIREFARIVQLPDFLGSPTHGTPGAALSEMIPRAAVARARARVADPAADDIADPIGRSEDVFRSSLAHISDAVDIIAAAAYKMVSTRG